MPNRILRDWTNSDKVESISPKAEVFFARLIMKADDFGCFWADSKRLKSNLFPLKSELRETDILRWMAECQKAGMIVVYNSDEKKYLQILDFDQRLRLKKSKFPQPTVNCQSNDGQTTDKRRPEEEVEVETEEKGTRAKEFIDTKIFSSKSQIEKEKISPGAEIFFTIEHCLTVALADERWANKNKASPELLELFNSELECQGVYEKNPADYKRHFYHWKKNQKNGAYQQPPSKSSPGKSAGANRILKSLKTDFANYEGSGSPGD